MRYHVVNVVWKMAAILSRPQCVKHIQRWSFNLIDKWTIQKPYGITRPQWFKLLLLSKLSYRKLKAWLTLASYQIRKIGGCACTGNARNDFPATDFKGNHKSAIPTCITACASRICHNACWDCLPAVAGKMFPPLPVHAQPAILCIW